MLKLTTNNCSQRYIGDLVSFQGQRYTITANYPRHGYLLMRVRRATGERTPQSMRVTYQDIQAA